MSGARLIFSETAEHLKEIRTLFREYEAFLGFPLCFQGFEEELASLPGKYSPPDGRLILAQVDEPARRSGRGGGSRRRKFAGCIALRPLEPGICEMKRLFVRDAFRGKGIGKALVLKLLEESRAIGYRSMRLDTVPKLKEAIALYESLGFRRIPPYCHNPIDGAIFMELVLSGRRA